MQFFVHSLVKRSTSSWTHDFLFWILKISILGNIEGQESFWSLACKYLLSAISIDFVPVSRFDCFLLLLFSCCFVCQPLSLGFFCFFGKPLVFSLLCQSCLLSLLGEPLLLLFFSESSLFFFLLSLLFFFGLECKSLLFGFGGQTDLFKTLTLRFFCFLSKSLLFFFRNPSLLLFLLAPLLLSLLNFFC